ncbi:N-acetylmuramoyl-L-alanine amidase [Rugosimonospora africana]|uniref:N-acetylmuramoyl-L-alanine amidase n=1 Tax=Rugosimonospora africana TaxID=556532 RepID=UPI0019410F19|nr:peptidoglycan recognition family protein [Rugosimonospora africana]
MLLSRPRTGGVAVVAGLVVLGTATGALAAPNGAADSRQQAYAAAAASSGVPESVLLGVSYLESLWNTNAGQPSTSGGFGPMHLTDVTYVASLPATGLGRGAASDAPSQTGRPRAEVAGTDQASTVQAAGANQAGADARGDSARPMTAGPRQAGATTTPATGTETLEVAAALTGLDKATLRTDPAANIRGGAAVLARYQRALGAPLSSDPDQWYGAVAEYAGATDADSAQQFADEVFDTIRSGAQRVTDDGHPVRLAATAGVPDRSWLDKLGLPRLPGSSNLECPKKLSCEWVPAPYQQLSADPTDYGNYDLADRPKTQKIRYIVIHDTEESFDGSLQLVQDPTYLGWHYTIRSADGLVAQHIATKNVGWHAGNWYVNSASVGVEHEGYAAQGSWYTEAMYRASAKLVRYLADKLDIPLDRQHIIGHDNVPGITPANVASMHWDPGPYWDWAHYFDLLGAPLHGTGNVHSGLVTIDPDYARNTPAFTGCDGTAADACAPHGSSSVILHTAPSADSPLVTDIGLHPDGSPSTMYISDHGARASAGQVYASAGTQGNWTAIWYLGQKAWFYNPPSARTARWSTGLVAVPKPGQASIPVYGRAYPEAAAYPAGVPVQTIVPMQYTFAAGQRYAVGGIVPSEYYKSSTFDGSSPGDHTVIRGSMKYVQIQFGHRIMYVDLNDVNLVPADWGSPA